MAQTRRRERGLVAGEVWAKLRGKSEEEEIPKLFEDLRGGLAQTRRRERGLVAGEVWDKLGRNDVFALTF